MIIGNKQKSKQTETHTDNSMKEKQDKKDYEQYNHPLETLYQKMKHTFCYLVLYLNSCRRIRY